MWQDPYSDYPSSHELQHPELALGPWHSLQWQQWQLWQQRTAASQWMDGFHHGGAQMWSEQLSEEETTTRLLNIKKDLEKAACAKLDHALKIVVSQDTETELSTCIERALFFLDHQDTDSSPRGADSSPRGAVDALRQATQAVEMCEAWRRSRRLFTDLNAAAEVSTDLDAAAKRVRDTLGVRVQLHALPMGNRKKFQSVLEAAWGGRLDKDESSKIYLSYRKTIWDKFEAAFNSNNKIANLSRGGPRPRRERGLKRLRRNPQLAQVATVAIRQPPGLEIRNVDGLEIRNVTDEAPVTAAAVWL